MSEFPHRIVIKIENTRTGELLSWLRDQGHELRRTMTFGGSHHIAPDNFIKLSVWFKEADDAMMFKLAWGGE